MLTNEQVRELTDKLNQEMKEAGIERMALVVPPYATCHYCGAKGFYGIEVVDTEILDNTGHDSIVTACQDITACFKRM